jgi:membrane-associated phospholipid phosphatase
MDAEGGPVGVLKNYLAMLGGANRTVPVMLAAIAGLVAIWLAMLLLGAGAGDRFILINLYAGQRHWLELIGLGLSRLGQENTLFVVTLAGAAWLVFRRCYWSALVLLLATYFGRMLASLQKADIGRLRPDELMHLSKVHSLSFPSGHAANSMIVFLTVSLLVARPGRERQWAVAAALSLSFLVGVSRVMLGVHWPSDVVAGWAFGSLWALMSWQLAEWLESSRIAAPKPG